MVSDKMKTFMAGSSVIRAMFEEGKKMAEKFGKENVYDFSLGNPSVEPPKEVTEALYKVIRETPQNELHGYPNNSGFEGVRRFLADKSNRIHSTSYTENNYVITTGAAAAINIVLKAILDPADEVIVFAPFFGEYKNYVRNYDGVIVPVLSDTKTFQPDMEKFKAAITKKTKAVIINTPNNPTGVIYSADTLKKMAGILCEKAKENGRAIYIISDEPYRDIVYTGETIPFVPDFYDNTFIAYSYSKSLSLPGERIGYVCANTKMEDFQTVTEALNIGNRICGFVNAPTIWQKVIPFVGNCTVDIDIYRKNRDTLYDMLVSLGYECVKPDGAFYLFPKTLIPDDAAFCNAAKEFNLLIVPGSSFGCPGFCRLAYCVSYETIVNSKESFRKLKEKFS